MKPAYITKLTAIASAVLAAVLVLIPFHAFLTVAASTITGNYEFIRLWKEVLLLVLVPAVVVIVWKTPGLWSRLKLQMQGGWLFWAIGCYVLLHIVLGLLALAKGQVNGYAMLYAWIINLRPMMIFVLAWVLASQMPWLHQNWKRLLLWPAAVVVGFGLLQATVLPPDFLQNFGYSASTIDPYQTVDQKEDYIRIQSTLRGSNPLGAYLVLALAAALVLLSRRKVRDNLLLAGLLTVGLLVLAATYSRSAYVGLIVVVLALALSAVRSRRAQLRLWAGLVVVALLLGGVFAVFRENDHLENTLFHTNEQSQSSVSSNEQRATALQGGSRDVLAEPFGRGPGTAGPASAHNLYPARISENYYLQLGQEVGLLGMGLFIAIVVMVGRRLWALREDALPKVLLVSLAGISFINLVQHAWADETLALLWWGLAGIALAVSGVGGQPAILKGNHHGKTKKASRNQPQTKKS